MSETFGSFSEEDINPVFYDPNTIIIQKRSKKNDLISSNHDLKIEQLMKINDDIVKKKNNLQQEYNQLFDLYTKIESQNKHYQHLLKQKQEEIRHLNNEIIKLNDQLSQRQSSCSTNNNHSDKQIKIINNQLDEFQGQFQQLFIRYKFNILDNWSEQQYINYTQNLKRKTSQFSQYNDSKTNNRVLMKKLKEKLNQFKNLLQSVAEPSNFIQMQHKIQQIKKKKQKLLQIPFISKVNLHQQKSRIHEIERNIILKLKGIRDDIFCRMEVDT